MRLKHAFEVMELDDQIIAVPVGKNSSDIQGVFKMNETAAFILDLLKEDTTEEAIIEAIKADYDVSEELLRKDVSHCIEMFKNRGMLIY